MEGLRLFHERCLYSATIKSGLVGHSSWYYITVVVEYNMGMSKRLDEGVGFNVGDVEEEELEEGEPIACTTHLDEETNPYYSNARRLNTRIPKINVRQILDKSDERYKEEFQVCLTLLYYSYSTHLSINGHTEDTSEKVSIQI